MKRILGCLAIGFLILGCATPTKKTQELEDRISELERLLETLESNKLSPEERNARVETQVSKLVEDLQALNESIEPLAKSGLKNQPMITVPEKLELISPSGTKGHKGFSGYRKSDGAKIQKKLEGPLTGPEKGNASRFLGKALPQSRFIGPNGAVFDLNDYKGKKNVLLVFMRGFAGQVCIACSAQTAVLARTMDQFQKRDTQIIVVYPGPPSSVTAFLQAVKDLEVSFNLPFPVLLDINLSAVKKYQIEGKLAKPTALVIDKKGLVQYAYSGKKYDDRPPINTLLQAIDHLP